MTRSLIIILFLGLVAFFLFQANYSRAITVGPPKMEYSADPGETIKGEFFVKNETQEISTFYPSFQKFIEDNGQKVFLKEESDLAVWVKTEKTVTLGPNENRKVPFTIEIPENAPPGGHFAVVWWSTAPPAEKGDQPLSIVTRAGILVLLRVSGDIKEEGRILNFSADRKIFWSLPVSFTVVFMNDGNVHLKPAGKITIKNIFNRTKTALTVNKGALQVLPESKRGFNEKWESATFAFGPYRAELNLVFGESKKEVSQSLWIWIFPLKGIIGLIVIFLLIFFVIPKGIKKYNQWVINKYSAKQH